MRLTPISAALSAFLIAVGGDVADEENEVRFGSVAFTADQVEHFLELSPLPPPPPDPTNEVYEDPRAAHLGRFLFFDERLSLDEETSCATCHDPGRGWSDGRQLARARSFHTRHSMTLWNVAYNRWFFWDGRSDSLWSQALVPLEDPREHATTRLAVAHRIAADDELRQAYVELFGELPELGDARRFPPEGRPVPDDPEHPHARAWEAMDPADRDAVNRVFANVGKALAAFQRGIVSRRAPFDVFVEGVREGDLSKQRWLGDPAKRGLRLFLGKAGCHVCHDGPAFTDREFHNNLVPPLEGRTPVDPGRFAGVELVLADPFNGVGRYSADPDGPARNKVGFLRRTSHNWSEFKTPSLRNVTLTAPYMHQGQIATLPEVVRYYSTLEDALVQHKGSERILQPSNLSEGEIADLLSFLESLTDPSLPPELEGPPPSPMWPDGVDGEEPAR